MRTIYVVITRLKTSGFTDTHTSLVEAFENEDDANKLLRSLESLYKEDSYVGKPEVVSVGLR